ncbi:MAG: dihydropteridine reductase, partial [Oscillospiraceae bacterium]
KRPANVFGYVFGSIGAIIMGAGMSLVMTDIGAQLGITNTMPVGIVIGLIGMLIAIINYPIYKAILSSRKEKYAERILALSEKIMKEGN